MSGFVKEHGEVTYAAGAADDLLYSVCAYLRDRGIHDAIIPILLSSGIGEAPDLNSELLFLQQLVLLCGGMQQLRRFVPLRDCG